MPGPRVKICGVTREEDVEMLDGRVDYVGFIVGPRVSPRVISLERARELASLIGRSTPVLVAHGVENDALLAMVEKASEFPVVQYHERKDPHQLRLLAAGLGERGVRLSPVSLWDGEAALPEPCRVSRLLGSYEYLLLDAVKSPLPPSGNQGLRVPPKVLEESSRCARRLGAAGGVRPGNVCHVVRAGVWLVDVSSGVESRPGVKDPLLVESLLEAVSSC